MPSPRRTRAEAGADRLTLAAGPALAVSGVGLCLALAGFAAVGPPLALPGTALAVLGLLSLVSTYLIARGVHVRGRTVNATVIEGQVLRMELEIRGFRPLGLVAATLEHPLLAEPYPLERARRVSPGAASGARRLSRAPRRLPLTGRPRRRGRLVIPAPRVRFSDALGLVQAERVGAGSMGELLVLPRVEPVHFRDSDLSGATAFARTAAAGTEATDLAGLRDYQPGTPATRIYWPALARGGNLLERFFEGEVEISPLIILDSRCGGTSEDTARLDAVIRAVASLTLELARAGAVDLLLPGRETALRIGAALSAWPGAHQALALLNEQSSSAAAPVVPNGRDGVLFYACVYPSLALAAQRRWGGRVLALTPRTATVAAPAPVLEVAGCVATQLGSA
jgi:uncharacterized protein (DUF58 family)